MRPFLNLHSQTCGTLSSVLIVIVFQTLPSDGAQPLRPHTSLDNAIILVLTESVIDPDDTGHSRYSPIHCQSKYEHQSTII